MQEDSVCFSENSSKSQKSMGNNGLNARPIRLVIDPNVNRGPVKPSVRTTLSQHLLNQAPNVPHTE